MRVALVEREGASRLGTWVMGLVGLWAGEMGWCTWIVRHARMGVVDEGA